MPWKAVLITMQSILLSPNIMLKLEKNTYQALLWKYLKLKLQKR